MAEEFQIRALGHQRAAAIRNVFDFEKIIFSIFVPAVTEEFMLVAQTESGIAAALDHLDTFRQGKRDFIAFPFAAGIDFL